MRSTPDLDTVSAPAECGWCRRRFRHSDVATEDAAVFMRYSQAKVNMMREALAPLDRKANEHGEAFRTAKLNQANFGTFGTKTAVEAAMKKLEPLKRNGFVVGGRGLEPRTFCL